MLFRFVLALAVMLSSAAAFSQNSAMIRGQRNATISPAVVQEGSSDAQFSVLTGNEIRDRIQELGGVQIEADLLNRTPIHETQRPSMSRIPGGVQSVTEDSGANQRMQPVRMNAWGQVNSTNESGAKQKPSRTSSSDLHSSSLVARSISDLAGAEVVMESQGIDQLGEGVSGSSMGATRLVAQDVEVVESAALLCTEFTLDILLDNWPGETTWVVEGSGGVVAQGGPYQEANAAVQSVFCLTDGCYVFKIFDSYGDGICCGYGSGNYSLTQGDNVIVSGGAFGTVESTEFCVGENLISGCTDSSACNFDSNAQSDDGSCDYTCVGCFEWSDLPTPLPPTFGEEFIGLPHFFDANLGSYEATYFQAFDFPSDFGQISLQALNLGIHYVGEWPIGPDVELVLDDPVDMTVSIYSHDVGAWGGDPSVLQLEGQFIHTFTETTLLTTVSIPLDLTFDLPSGSEDNVVVGIELPNMVQGGAFFLVEAPNNGNPGWILGGGNTIAANLSSFADLPSLQISLEGCADCSALDACGVCGGNGSSCYFGCTDAGACNYDSGAVEDDGSCSFEGCYGCTDDTACNYVSEATFDDGSCDFTSCAGCLNLSEFGSLPDSYSAATIFCAEGSSHFWKDFSVQTNGDDFTVLSLDVNIGEVGTLDADFLLIPGNANLTVRLHTSSGSSWDGDVSGLIALDSAVVALSPADAYSTLNIPFDQSYALGAGPEGVLVVEIEYSTMGAAQDYVSIGVGQSASGESYWSGAGCGAPFPMRLAELGVAGMDAETNVLLAVNGCVDCSNVDACGVCGGNNEGCSGCMDETACNYDDVALVNDGSCDYDCGGCLDASSSDGLVPYTYTSGGLLDTLMLGACADGVTGVASPTVMYQTIDFEAESGQYTILSFDVMLGYWVNFVNGEYFYADWDVTYNVWGNLSGAAFDGDLSNYALLGTVTETHSAGYGLNGGFYSAVTLPLGVTMDVVPGGLDDVVVEIIPSTSDALAFAWPGYEPSPGTSTWFQAEACGFNDPVPYASLNIESANPAIGIVLNGCENCSDIDECGVCGGDGSTCLPGCTDWGACNYSEQAGVDDGSCDYSCIGCTYPQACNYNPDATVDDGSCDISCAGCLSLATYDEITLPFVDMVNCFYDFGGDLTITGSNDYWVPLHAESETGEYTVLSLQFLVMEADPTHAGEPITVDLTVELYTHDAGAWSGDLEALTLVHSQLHPITTTLSPQTQTVDIQSTFDIPATDEDNLIVRIGVPSLLSFGEINEGLIILGALDDADAQVLTYFSSQTCGLEEPFLYTVPEGEEGGANLALYVSGCVDCSNVDDCGICAGDGSFCALGCTIETACNYSAVAIEDDGSCEFESCYGCTDEGACNYEEDALYDDGSCDFSLHTVMVNIQLDLFPAQTTWVLSDETGNVLFDGGPYWYEDPDAASISIPVCVPQGCYEFTIYDYSGDGICCVPGNPQGEYAVLLDGEVIGSGASFGSEETLSFCTYEVQGCMDSNYCNYNAFASVDDGSCNNDGGRMISITGETYYGWTEPADGVISGPPGPWTIFNSSGVPVLSAPASAPEFAVLDTITHLFCAGCYSWQYSVDEYYWGALFGPMKMEMGGFSMTLPYAEGNEPHEFCIAYGGCMNVQAINFDSVAEVDDGSCVFDTVANPCPQDLNGDGTVSVADLLNLLGVFGEDCSE